MPSCRQTESSQCRAGRPWRGRRVVRYNQGFVRGRRSPARPTDLAVQGNGVAIVGDKLRIGAVRYLNSKPLIECLPEMLPEAQITVDFPSRLAARR